MAIFAILYFVLIIYAVALRLGIRSQTKLNQPVGLLYKIQAVIGVGISMATATTICILFAKSPVEWLVQYLPTVLIILIVVVWRKKSKSL